MSDHDPNCEYCAEARRAEDGDRQLRITITVAPEDSPDETLGVGMVISEKGARTYPELLAAWLDKMSRKLFDDWLVQDALPHPCGPIPCPPMQEFTMLTPDVDIDAEIQRFIDDNLPPIDPTGTT